MHPMNGKQEQDSIDASSLKKTSFRLQTRPLSIEHDWVALGYSGIDLVPSIIKL